jgi:hypothetical protein
MEKTGLALLKDLQLLKNNHTSMISLDIPAGYNH